ncbi:hypothetical protein A2716_00455 [candidate division WWE3 bacterium RIFCSPHIGHO2_01_FULL_40_23]|uniref:PDZ domain-containing protein n=1 Tax=candidate division WWE3 bacterium RIFCSPLOWO2_01_FULL_41_18 TaxID=1802625 RepID=A0A1F4VDV6_UNCKA|nr:MAG: hypothetical protein A2716_00455 [candidate division WWE3 bacterium RIFCSPHIGHO2_01_FULL_40_23]OGC55466.1 MAG: hypothetical protein A3A78_00725 [candidate division WWE3 bacterium RIFCSPLOWO2_01_FULL_41_18]
MNKKLSGILFFLLFIFILFGVFLNFNKGFSVRSFLSDLKNKILKGEFTEIKTNILLKQSVVEEESAVIRVVENVSPAVVSIVEKTVGFDPFSGPVSSEEGIGTGFIVDTLGVVVTNSHVVFNTSADYSVVLKDGSSYDVKKIHRDTLNDLAILELSAKNLPVVELGDAEKLKVGQKAIAIGNALGQFSNTVTVGVVSGLARQVTASGPFGESPKTYNDVIQTDAALNPGNSGGPLLNLYGQVIGVNVATTRGAENIGFAIPVNRLKPILESFKESGRIIRPYLGVNFSMITKDISGFSRFPEGAFVRGVGVATPAERAGIERGDIITKMNGRGISEKNPLDLDIQANNKVGDRVRVTLDRNGEIITVEVTLEEAPQE